MLTTTTTKPLFEPGQIEITSRARVIAERYDIDTSQLVERHVSGSWDEIHPNDAAANLRAIKTGERIVSVWGQGSPYKLYLLTEEATHDCERCATERGTCEPRRGKWVGRRHVRIDLPARRLRTLVMTPHDYREYADRSG